MQGIGINSQSAASGSRSRDVTSNKATIAISRICMSVINKRKVKNFPSGLRIGCVELPRVRQGDCQAVRARCTMHDARMEMVYDRSIEDILTGKEVTGRGRWERSKETPNRGSYSTKPRRTGSTGVAEGAEGVIESRTRRRGEEGR